MRERILTVVSLLLVALVSFSNLCYCDEQTVIARFLGKVSVFRFVH